MQHFVRDSTVLKPHSVAAAARWGQIETCRVRVVASNLAGAPAVYRAIPTCVADGKGSRLLSVPMRQGVSEGPNSLDKNGPMR